MERLRHIAIAASLLSGSLVLAGCMTGGPTRAEQLAAYQAHAGEPVDKIHYFSPIGWDKVDSSNPAYRFVNVYRVVTNLGVFDFNGPDHQMRAVSLHPGITPEEVREHTSFEVHDLDNAEPTRLPTADELKLLREVIDPKTLRDKEIRR